MTVLKSTEMINSFLLYYCHFHFVEEEASIDMAVVDLKDNLDKTN